MESPVLNTSDVVDVLTDDGTKRGQIIDVRGSGNPAAGTIRFTYIVLPDGEDPIVVTDRARLSKVPA